MKKGYFTWFVLLLLYILFAGIPPFGVFPALLFFAGQYQVLRREMKLQENKRSYIFLIIGLSALIGIPFFNGVIYIRGGIDNAIGVGNLVYLCIFYYLQKYFLMYDTSDRNLKKHTGDKRKSTIVDRLIIIIPVCAYLLLLLLKFMTK